MKTIKLQIVKPVNVEWDMFGHALRDVQYETWQVLNKTVQLAWEYFNFTARYKTLSGEFPNMKELSNYKTLGGFAYNELKGQYARMSTNVLVETVNRADKRWKADLKDILNGRKSIPSFKRTTPIFVPATSITVKNNESGYMVCAGLISKTHTKEIGKEKNGVFELLVDVKDNSSKAILDRVIDKTYKMGACMIMKHKTKNKWFVNVSYQAEKEERNPDKNNVMGIDLGIKYPVYIAFNNSAARYHIAGKEIERFRYQVDSRRKEMLRQGKYCGDGRTGHGRTKRLQPTDKLAGKIKNFKDTCNHKYSRYVIDMATKHGCGTIQMEDLTGIAQGELPRFLKNWTYYDLQQKIEYKAKDAGIDVVYIKPDYTSQRCNKCGFISKENRKNQAEFKCVAEGCGYEANADYNAALNIATLGIEAIIAREKVREEAQAV